LLVDEGNQSASAPDNACPGITAVNDTSYAIIGASGNVDRVIELTGFDTTGMNSVQVIDTLPLGGGLVCD